MIVWKVAESLTIAKFFCRVNWQNCFGPAWVEPFHGAPVPVLLQHPKRRLSLRSLRLCSATLSELTRILQSIEAGTPQSADALLPLVYAELRQLAAAKMARERPGQTLQPTALVHEAWLRLSMGAPPSWENRRHFFGAAAEAMRRILIERARRRQVLAKGGYAEREEDFESRLVANAPEDELLAVHDALDELAKDDPPAAELVKLRYFVGLTMPEAAEAMGLPLRNTERLWTFARAWLRKALKDK